MIDSLLSFFGVPRPEAMRKQQIAEAVRMVLHFEAKTEECDAMAKMYRARALRLGVVIPTNPVPSSLVFGGRGGGAMPGTQHGGAQQ